MLNFYNMVISIYNITVYLQNNYVSTRVHKLFLYIFVTECKNVNFTSVDDQETFLECIKYM